MRNTSVIKIDKSYNKEEVYQAVLAYMSPSGEREQVKTEIGSNFYIIKKEWLKSPKKGLWVMASTVKLTFSEGACYVDVEYSNVGKKNGIGSTAAGLVTGATAASAVAFPPLLIVAGGAALATRAVIDKEEEAGLNKFKEDLYKLIKGYLCSETRQSISAIGRQCQCGAVLQEGAKFCPECGKKVEEPSKQSEEIVCECGTVLPKGTKFCPICGKGTAG